MSDNIKMSLLEKFIKEAIEQVIQEKAKKSSKTTPGGGLTDAGALRRVNKSAFMSNVRNALHGQHGDVEDAAKSVGVAPRTLYYYLEDEPKLQKVKDHAEEEAEKAEKNKKEIQKKQEEKEEKEQ